MLRQGFLGHSSDATLTPVRHGLSQHIDHTTALIWDRDVQNKWSGYEGLPPDFVQMFLSKLADFEFKSADDSSGVPQVYHFWKSTSDKVSAPRFVYTYPWRKDKPGHLVYLKLLVPDHNKKRRSNSGLSS